MKYVYETRDEKRGIALLGYHPEGRSVGISRYSVYSLV